jgi:glutaredoxin
MIRFHARPIVSLSIALVLLPAGCVLRLRKTDRSADVTEYSGASASQCVDGVGAVVAEQREAIERPSVDIRYPAIRFPCDRTSRDVEDPIVGTLRMEEKEFMEAVGAGSLEEDVFFLSIHCRVERLDPHWVSVGCSHDSFTGGAHPWHAFKSFNFFIDDAKRAHAVELADLFTAGWQPALESLAIDSVEPKAWLDEELLRASIERGMPFTLTEGNLQLLFDPYAAGPYIGGSRIAVIPFERLGGLLRQGVVPNPPPASTTPSMIPTAVAAPLAAPSAAPKHVPVVLLYGMHSCGHCNNAEAHMKSRSIPYTYRDVSDPLVNKEFAHKLAASGQKGTTSIPVIEIDGELEIGWSAQVFDKRYDAKAK